MGLEPTHICSLTVDLALSLSEEGDTQHGSRRCGTCQFEPCRVAVQ